jgi:uncharacterized protein (TIGR03435 family)
MLVEAIFWFHPLVWWIGSRLVEERERACDEAVLSLGSEPQVYAEGILNVCKIYSESPLRCVSGVTGSDLKKRIQAILTGRIASELNFAKRVALAAAGIAALALPVVVGIVNAPAIRAQSSAKPAQAGPKFDVASIKLAAPEEHFMFGVRPMPGGGINATNVTLKLLIETAYGLEGFQVFGGPGWIETARYNIEAKPDSPVGPNEWKKMLKNLLANRFQLAFHLEAKELPVYALVLARKDGKLDSGMVESKEGGCIARDPSKPLGPPGRGQPPFCGNVLGGASILTATTATLGDITPMLSRMVGRKVIDKTGLTGKYDITLKYTPDENQLAMMVPPGAPPPPTADTTGPSLFTALQEQLGLKLESEKGLVEIFVIDRADRPSEN